MAGRLTTHVLDTVQGRPAAGIEIELWRIDDAARTRLKTVRTNVDGRTDVPLLLDDELTAGVYELVFAVGAYFDTQGIAMSQPAFLDRVPVRFRIAHPDSHYHVPLLASPWAYSTYRGS